MAAALHMAAALRMAGHPLLAAMSQREKGKTEQPCPLRDLYIKVKTSHDDVQKFLFSSCIHC